MLVKAEHIDLSHAKHEMSTSDFNDPFIYANYQILESFGIYINRYHWHEGIEMIYAEYAEGEIEVYTVDKTYRLNTGDFIILNAKMCHAVYARAKKGEKNRLLVVKFNPDIFFTSSDFDSVKFITPFVMNNEKINRYFSSKIMVNSPIPNLMRKLEKEYVNKRIAYLLEMKSCVYSIIVYLIREYFKDDKVFSTIVSVTASNRSILRKALDYIEEKYYEDLSPTEIAKECNISYSYFAKLFKNYSGMSFIQYLNKIRIAEAEKLLLATDLNNTEIASSVGFNYKSYFMKQFKLNRGMTPKKFRDIMMSKTSERNNK